MDEDCKRKPELDTACRAEEGMETGQVNVKKKNGKHERFGNRSWEPDGDDRAWGTQENGGGYIAFETGVLSQRELEAMLNTLPVDITFVDKDGIVKYFSQGTERIFPRTKAVIGRTVTNCHPPASVHIVEKIVEDLKSGKRITRISG